MIKPQVIEHDGVLVVRDDLFEGGTKARFIPLTVQRRQRGSLCKPGRGRRLATNIVARLPSCDATVASAVCA